MNVFFLRNYTNWLSDGVLDLSLTNGVNAISLNLLFSHELVFFFPRDFVLLSSRTYFEDQN